MTHENVLEEMLTVQQLSTAWKLDKLERFSTGKPYEEWGEDDGPVLWWRMPICEPPYLGDPLCNSWPFDAEDIADLLWTPIGDATAIMDRWLANRPKPTAPAGGAR